jgi:hypothetical protein
MSVYDRISDRTRPCETVYTAECEVYSTSEPNRIKAVYESYGIVRTVPKSLIQYPINTRMSQDHGTIQTSAHTVSYDRHTTNTVDIRNIHGRHGIVRVYTVSHCLVRSSTASTSARTIQKTQLPAATLPRVLAASL